MEFEEVIKDLLKLIGINLDSIKPGAEITILDIDSDLERVAIKNVAGKINNRPLSELRKIWNKLLTEPAVHVEGVLNGSGSSRNQPETMLANLPYIEWTRINRKKHLVYMGENTHPYGTIKELSPFERAKIMDLYQEKEENNLTLHIVEEITDATNAFSRFFGLVPYALGNGIYYFQTLNGRIIFASSRKVNLPCGNYIFLKLKYDQAATVQFLGEDYCYTSICGIDFLCKK